MLHAIRNWRYRRLTERLTLAAHHVQQAINRIDDYLGTPIHLRSDYSRTVNGIPEIPAEIQRQIDRMRIDSARDL